MADSKTPSKAVTKDNVPETTHWAFIGFYPATYLTPGLVSRLVEPGEVIEWGTAGPPDSNWEPVEAPGKTSKKDEPAPSPSDKKE